MPRQKSTARTESVKVLKRTLTARKSKGKSKGNTLENTLRNTLGKSLRKPSKPIKIILIISGHGFCETIECHGNQCPFSANKSQTPCKFDNEKSALHKCGDATKEFHMSDYTRDIKLYSYAPYGLQNWSNKFKIFVNTDDTDGKNGLYYNDFSRLYNVNRQIEATLEAIRIPYKNFDNLMEHITTRINDPDYISTFIDVNPICKSEPSKIDLKIKKAIVKELYQFDDYNRSDNDKFTMLKKPIEEVGWVPWFWKLLGYHKYEQHSVLPHDTFSGIFVAFTNSEYSFSKAPELLPRAGNPNYNCDFTLFSHIERIGGMKLCKLILNYINYWNKYIDIEFSENKCQRQINEIVLNNVLNRFTLGRVKYTEDIFTVRFWKENPPKLASKITFINNESLYHIVNIILNFNIAMAEEDLDLISTLTSFFETNPYDDLTVEAFKNLLDAICPMFNVELHLISNACRRTKEPIKDIDIDARILELQQQCAIDMEIGGKKTKKRKRHTKKRKHLYKKIKTRKYKK